MTIDLANPGRPIHAGVILTKGITEMLDVAPFELFAGLGAQDLTMLGFPDEMVAEAIDVKLHWVTEDGATVQLRSQAQIKPTDSFATCPPLDIALMGAHNPQYKTSEAELAFIRKTYEDCTAFLSVCGGIIPFLEAGLLMGKTVSCPRPIVEKLKKEVPVVNWVDKRWSHDGKIWSSSTLLNGTDLVRGFAQATWGGRSGMIEALLDSLHFPDRDIDFKDYKGVNYAMKV